MTEKQNDQRSQQPDSKSNQQTTQDGNKKETNPDNSTANQGTPAGSQQGNQQRKDSTSNEGKASTDVLEIEENEEEKTDETHGAKKTGEPDSNKMKVKPEIKTLRKEICESIL